MVSRRFDRHQNTSASTSIITSSSKSRLSSIKLRQQTVKALAPSSSSSFFPHHQTYNSLRKTSKKGVAKSLIPWTYPVAGRLIDQQYRTRSKLCFTGGNWKMGLSGQVRGTSMLIWCKISSFKSKEGRSFAAFTASLSESTDVARGSLPKYFSTISR